MDTKQVKFGNLTFPVARITVGIRERAAEKFPDTNDDRHYLFLIAESARRADPKGPTYEALCDEAETPLIMDTYKTLVNFSYGREVTNEAPDPQSAAANGSPGQG